MTKFIQLTSLHNTPLYVRKSAILYVEGFTLKPDHETHPNHVGSRLTLLAGQWSEAAMCLEPTDKVISLLELDE